MKPKYTIALGNPDGYVIAATIFDAIETKAAETQGIGMGLTFEEECPVCLWGHVIALGIHEEYNVPRFSAIQAAYAFSPKDMTQRMEAANADLGERGTSEESIQRLISACPVPGITSDEAVALVLKNKQGKSSAYEIDRIPFAEWCEALGVERGPDKTDSKMTGEERLQLFNRLIEDGMSDAEARDTAWPTADSHDPIDYDPPELRDGYGETPPHYPEEL